jgi:Protein of Unknown function (DUF2784)
MGYRLLADGLVVVHTTFVGFVILGGLLALRWPRVAFLHLPAAAWGVVIEFAGWVCPLTPLENQAREAGGGAAYQGDFIEHYLLPVLYPAELTRQVQYALGAGALLLNVAVYALVIARRRRRRAAWAPGTRDGGRG